MEPTSSVSLSPSHDRRFAVRIGIVLGLFWTIILAGSFLGISASVPSFWASAAPEIRQSALICLIFWILGILGTSGVSMSLYQRAKARSRAEEQLLRLAQEQENRINERTAELVLEQHRIEEQRALLDTVFSSSPDLIWYKDPEDKYLMVNPRFATIMNKKPDELKGCRPKDFFPPDMAAAIERNDAAAVAHGGSLVSEDQITFADGHTEFLDSVRTPIYDGNGNLCGLLGVSRDVSRRVNVEQKLRRIQEQLKNTVEEANKASAAKSEFLARMSHEIRTPMNAIIGMTNIVQRKLEENKAIPGEIHSHLRQLEISAKHLLGLLNDILDISKIEAGKIELSEEPFSISQLINAVSSIIEPRCTEKNITFEVLTESLIFDNFLCDPLRLRQVLINLLGNAVKFTPECGRITFSVQSLEQRGDTEVIEFSVQDSGIGIPAQMMEHLFSPFEQGHVTRQYGGTGLGLSISKRIVQLFGGDITVASEENKGSLFRFAIRLRRTEQIEEQERKADVDMLRGKRILLADDVDINRIIVTELLTDTGLIIDEAGDGQAALDTFAASPAGYYDLILMDVRMPKMDGYEATRAIRKLTRSDASLPIVALTANAFKEDVDTAIACGMNAHLAKPLEYKKMLALLMRLMKRK